MIVPLRKRLPLKLFISETYRPHVNCIVYMVIHFRRKIYKIRLSLKTSENSVEYCIHSARKPFIRYGNYISEKRPYPAFGIFLEKLGKINSIV